MAIRNFWIDINVDGRLPIGAGPKRKDGGFTEEIYIRDSGESKKAVSICGSINIYGIIKLSIDTVNGEHFEIKTAQ